MSAQPAPVHPIRFQWTSSFMGCIEYEVHGDGPMYLAELRREAGSYGRSIFNGAEEEWHRDVVGAVNVLRRKYEITQPIDQHVIDAFNAWRATKHQLSLNEILSQPEKFGALPDADPLRIPPPAVRGGHYEMGRGWAVSRDADSQIEETSPSP